MVDDSIVGVEVSIGWVFSLGEEVCEESDDFVEIDDSFAEMLVEEVSDKDASTEDVSVMAVELFSLDRDVSFSVFESSARVEVDSSL